MFRRYIDNRRVLTSLQRTQIGDDCPTICDHDVRPVGHHRVLVVRDRVENFAVGHLTNAIVLQSDDGIEAVLFGNSIPRCGRPVTHRASNVETLTAALKQLRRDRNGDSSSPIVAHFSGVDVIGADAKSSCALRLGRAGRLSFRHFITDRHRPIDRHPGTATVRKKVQRRLCAHFHLSHHIGKNFPRFVGGFFSAKPEDGDGRNRDQQRN